MTGDARTAAKPDGLHLSTFSIVGRCARSGMLGVSVATAVPAVGAVCSWAKARVGAAATQSWANPYLAIDALAMLERGLAPATAIEAVMTEDPERSLRQLGLVDSQGRSAAWTGEGGIGWRGHFTGPGYAVQGTQLPGEAVLTVMVEAFLANETADLAERLMLALEAGEAAGGDKRGKQSAALLVYDTEDYAWLDLRVDEHAAPVLELRRILGVARHQLLPFVEGMTKRGRVAEGPSPSVIDVLLRPPPSRPGGGGSAA